MQTILAPRKKGFVNISSQEIARVIDYTLLKSTATKQDIMGLCEDARRYAFCAVIVPQSYVSLTSSLLRESSVRVGTVVGFPLGSSSSEAKAFAALTALRQGAREIDMVMNIGALKSGDYDFVFKDIQTVLHAVRRCRGSVLKVIINTPYLTHEEKVDAAGIVKRAGADFVKTSTGFGPGGATIEDVKLIRAVVGTRMGVKAAGGIRTLEQVTDLLEAGADRIGTSSGAEIMRELQLATKTSPILKS